MLALPMVFYAAGLANRHVVVAGDFRQLPPIVVSDEPKVLEWLKKDIFHKAGIASAVDNEATVKSLICLRRQYRMHEDICEVVNSVFYAERLQTDEEVRRRSMTDLALPLGVSSLSYVDTSPYHPWAALRLGTYSRYNMFHALLACRLVDLLVPAAEHSDSTVGIVTPYAAQTRLIRGLLEDRLKGGPAQLASTVHQFQGNERDTILVDLTDSVGVRLSKFMQAERLDDDGARLLNVALSRARRHVILVANFSYFVGKLGSRALGARLLQLFVKKGAPLDVDGVLPLRQEDWAAGLHSLSGPQVTLDTVLARVFTEGSFYSAFLQDLTACNESIVVFSPYLTPRGLGRWMDVLRLKMSQGGPRSDRHSTSWRPRGQPRGGPG